MVMIERPTPMMRYVPLTLCVGSDAAYRWRVLRETLHQHTLAVIVVAVIFEAVVVVAVVVAVVL